MNPLNDLPKILIGKLSITTRMLAWVKYLKLSLGKFNFQAKPGDQIVFNKKTTLHYQDI